MKGIVLITIILQLLNPPKEDNRIIAIRQLLRETKSPVAEEARTIVILADKYQLDPYIIVAIAGVESSYWKNCHDWNCYGWGVTDSGYLSGVKGKDWTTFESGLETFCLEFSRNYSGKTLDKISNMGYNTRQEWKNNTNFIYQKLAQNERLLDN